MSQAADSLGLSTATLRIQIAAGKLSAAKIGHAYVIEKEEVERYRRENLGRAGRPRIESKTETGNQND